MSNQENQKIAYSNLVGALSLLESTYKELEKKPQDPKTKENLLKEKISVIFSFKIYKDYIDKVNINDCKENLIQIINKYEGQTAADKFRKGLNSSGLNSSLSNLEAVLK